VIGECIVTVEVVISISLVSALFLGLLVQYSYPPCPERADNIAQSRTKVFNHGVFVNRLHESRPVDESKTS
jgi:hypothetical protein